MIKSRCGRAGTRHVGHSHGDHHPRMSLLSKFVSMIAQCPRHLSNHSCAANHCDRGANRQDQRRSSVQVQLHEDTAHFLLTATLCRSFSLPTFLLREHKGQNNVVQHAHPRWMDFETRLPFFKTAACPMEFGDYRLILIHGDQLQNQAMGSVSRVLVQ